MDKIRGIYNYCKTLPEDEIVVFIDGFDSSIAKPLIDLEKTFANCECKVLISREIVYNDYLSSIIAEYINNKIYNPNKNAHVVNSGLYMGFVKYLIVFLEDVLHQKSTDDQLNFNIVLPKYEWVKIDTDYKIFYNTNGTKNEIIPDVYFISDPGSKPGLTSIEKYIFRFKTFHMFFIREISLVFFITALILFMWRM
jgi:hypothetical protein